MNVIQKKVCLLGDFAVGKTSLVRRFVEGRFDDSYLSTIGVKISRRRMVRDDHTLNLIVWDLAGGERFSRPESSYLRGAAGALLVCDLTRRETADTLARYVHDLEAISPGAAVVLVANKADLDAQRELSDATLAALADQFAAPLLLTSAKSGRNVAEAFTLLADQLASAV